VTEADLIEDVFVKEGVRYGDQTTTPPIDQPTAAGGIVLDTLKAYRKAMGLAGTSTVDDLRALTKETATPIVRWMLRRIASDHGFASVEYEPLRLQLIDFAYNSGGELAIRWLQRVLDVARSGRFDPTTKWALAKHEPRLVHQALIAARLQMIDSWTDSAVPRKKWEEGLENRALSFSVLEVP
jgi:lysozyme family protein